MKMGVLVLMLLFLVVLIALFYMSFKILGKVRQQERAENAAKAPQRQLHPKIQAQRDQQKRDQEKAEQEKK
ncbi:MULTISPECIES: hypothetical protein [unclassified Acinetobacter]|uniref:hypothetical protein n=1 Tax=unclassified Acinetobacter TaxID=196816 RepID=UPI000A32B783|nr:MULTISPECIES: hypothetical protein [unclassified Acinetobacter]MDN5511045.1 hypothetical protein [Acinetobacter sp.]MDN5524653.1 hypothetical protein [Acinetobacter sp.]OTG62518.1 hypothetical protein B9T29_06935 [Acinetobacter sp. ANC 3903]